MNTSLASPSLVFSLMFSLKQQSECGMDEGRSRQITLRAARRTWNRRSDEEGIRQKTEGRGYRLGERAVDMARLLAVLLDEAMARAVESWG